MKKINLYLVALISLMGTYACGSGGGAKSVENQADSIKKDSLAKVAQTPHPDTTYASVKKLKAIKIDTFL